MNTSSEPDRYGVVGFPVRHSRSPLVHRLFADQTAQNLTYELLEAAPAAFESVVREFAASGGKGLNVTVPHKEAAFALSTRLGAEAERAGAVNTLSFDAGTVRGDNTDGIGLLRDLTMNLGCEIAGRRLLVLGAGGAARGILPPLLERRPAALVLANRTPARAVELRERFRALGDIIAASPDELAGGGPFDLVINATSAGLHGEQPPFPPEIVGPHSVCYDLSYAPAGTPFVAWAKGLGAACAEQGLGMLVEQAAESFFIWRGIRPDTRPVIGCLAAEAAREGAPG